MTNDGQVGGTSDNRWEEEKYNIEKREKDKRNWTCEIKDCRTGRKCPQRKKWTGINDIEINLRLS